MAFNIGPSNGKMVRGGNNFAPRPPMGGMNRPQVMPRPQDPSMGRPLGNSPFGMGPMPQMGPVPPISTTNPVGMQRPNIIPMPSGMPSGMGEGMMQQPGQQPLEENQLWRTYNRLLGGDKGSMGPRMLL